MHEVGGVKPALIPVEDQLWQGYLEVVRLGEQLEVGTPAVEKFSP